MDEKIKKNLFRKPTSADWISIIMWIGIFALAYFYYTDITALSSALYECQTQLVTYMEANSTATTFTFPIG